MPFHREKIAEAIFRAAQSVGGEDRFLAEELAGVVTSQLERLAPGGESARARLWIPTIEDVQDTVERVLIEAGHARTAKSYILYRDRRAQARRRRAEAHVPGAVEDAVRPLVGSGSPASVLPEASEPDVADAATSAASRTGTRRWSKAEIVHALERQDRLDRNEAEDIARSVEEQILSSGVPRISQDLLIALVRTEMFRRGRTSTIGRGEVVGLPASHIDRALREGLTHRRATSPASVAAGLGERMIARHLLDGVLPPAVAEAQRVGDLHAYDLGAPLRLTAVGLDAANVVGAHLDGEHFSHGGGIRRVTRALEEVLLRHAPHVARVLALEHVNVLLAPFWAHLDEDALGEEVRQLLLGPVLAAWHRRGGLLAVELGLSAEVPERLRSIETPPPSPPGRTYGDLADAALRVTRAFLREAVALRRDGHEVPCALTLLVPRRGDRDAAMVALVNQALTAAAQTGEPVIVLDDAATTSRGSRWHRVTESEALDPLRFDRGDVSAASATAVNLVAAALRTRKAGLHDFMREVERLAGLAVEAAAARHGLLLGVCNDPGGALYELCRGTHPLVDLESACHLVELVGVDQAVTLLAPHKADSEAARAALRTRIVSHAAQRVMHEATAHRINAVVVEAVSEEAASRLARIDRERFPQTSTWWAEGEAPTYRPDLGLGVRREPICADPSGGERSRVRVRHRIDGERRPPLQDLRSSFDTVEHDARVFEYSLAPWPLRHLRVARSVGGGAQ